MIQKPRTKAIILAIFALAISGCGLTTQVTPTYTPDGKQAYSLSCSGPSQSWAHCEAEAGKICGERGYTIVSQTNDPALRGMGVSSMASTRGMLITCN